MPLGRLVVLGRTDLLLDLGDLLFQGRHRRGRSPCGGTTLLDPDVPRCRGLLGIGRAAVPAPSRHRRVSEPLSTPGRFHRRLPWTTCSSNRSTRSRFAIRSSSKGSRVSGTWASWLPTTSANSW